MLSLIKLKELALDVLFPPLCLNCNRLLKNQEKDNGICDACFAKISVHTALFCPVCRARLPENKKICHQSSSYRLGAAANYDEPLKTLIHRFKYHSWSRLQKPIAKILENYLKNLNLELKGGWLIIPIPLHKNRERTRGFNQAGIIGKIAADYFRLPYEDRILSRSKKTQTQAELKNWDQRKENLSGAFAVSNAEQIKNKNIVLVDDVYTSGATINEAVKVLRSAGAKKILAIVLAKAK